MCPPVALTTSRRRSGTDAHVRRTVWSSMRPGYRAGGQRYSCGRIFRPYLLEWTGCINPSGSSLGWMEATFLLTRMSWDGPCTKSGCHVQCVGWCKVLEKDVVVSISLSKPRNHLLFQCSPRKLGCSPSQVGFNEHKG